MPRIGKMKDNNAIYMSRGDAYAKLYANKKVLLSNVYGPSHNREGSEVVKMSRINHNMIY